MHDAASCTVITTNSLVVIDVVAVAAAAAAVIIVKAVDLLLLTKLPSSDYTYKVSTANLSQVQQAMSQAQVAPNSGWHC